MIVSFKHKGLKRFYETGETRGIKQSHSKKISQILSIMDVANDIDDLDIPSLRLHELKGNKKGRWSVTINKNWRITFALNDGDFEVLDYEDYH